ncbi:MAG TPA: hypothetical protein PKK39_08435 [Tepidiformaceae bacterium]|nr:hypothetical protein [Tepidiformaceae bacterium]
MLEHRTPGRSRRTTLLVGAIVVAALAAVLALALRLSGNEGVVLTGTSTYVEGVSGTWQRVNPLFASANEVDADLSELVFSGLVFSCPVAIPCSCPEVVPSATPPGEEI